MRGSRRSQATHNRARSHAGRINGSGHPEDGFTLIELLIVIIILPIVIGGIAAALIAILQNDSTTFNRVADSADAQITSANFTRDVQSATSITTAYFTGPMAPGPGGGNCWPASSAPPTGSRPLVTLAWGQTIARKVTDAAVQSNGTFTSVQANFTSADIGSNVTDTGDAFGGNVLEIDNIVGDEAFVNGATTALSPDTVTIETSKNWRSTYWDVPVGSGPTYDLIRQFCQEGTFARFLSTTIVAHDLPANQGNVTITCGPSVPAAECTSSYLSSPSHSPLSTAGVTSVNLSAVEPASGYQFNLSATPRNSTSSDSGVLSLLMTGSSSNLAVSGANDALTVDGELAFNPSSGSVAPGGTSDSIAVDPVPGQAPIVGYQCNSQCGQITSSFAGTLKCSGLTCPTPESLNSSSTISYPYLGAPVNPGVDGQVQNCNGQPICYPGYYPTAQTLTGNVTFEPGNYLFAGNVAISGASPKITFGAGDYTFDTGLDTPAGASDVSLSGTGVFFYFAKSTPGCSTCSFDVDTDYNGVGTAPSIQLSAPTSGPYQGLLMYQPNIYTVDINTSPMIITSPYATSTLGGVIDAPAATVYLGTIHETLNLGGLVAGGVTLLPTSTSVNVTVGN